MNYSYFANELPNQTLESFLEDEKSCPSSIVYQNSVSSSGEGGLHDPNHVYQNKTPIAGDTIIHDPSQSFFDQNDKFSSLHSNSAKQNGMIT